MEKGMEAAASPPHSNGPARKKRVSRRLPKGSNPAKALKTSAAGKKGKSKKSPNSSTSSSGRSSTQVDEGEEENQEEEEESEPGSSLPAHVVLKIMSFSAPDAVDALQALANPSWVAKYVESAAKQLHKHARRTLPDFTKTPLLNLDFALKKECAICRQKFAGAFTDFLVYGHPKCVRSRVTNTYYLGQEGEANLPPEMLRVQYTGWQPYSKQPYDYMCVWEHRHPCVLPRNTLEHVEACYIPYREHMERVAAAEREAKEAERQAKLRRADLEARRAKARDARVQRVFTDVSALMQAWRSADEGPAEREDQQHGDYDLPSFKKLLARRRATARLLLGDASEDRITCKAKHAVSAANVKSYFIVLEHRGGPTPEARSQFEQDFDNFALYHEAATNMHTAWDYAAMEAKFLAWLVDRRKKQALAKSKKSRREEIAERNRRKAGKCVGSLCSNIPSPACPHACCRKCCPGPCPRHGSGVEGGSRLLGQKGGSTGRFESPDDDRQGQT